jgi:hypothetical protein
MFRPHEDHLASNADRLAGLLTRALDKVIFPRYEIQEDDLDVVGHLSKRAEKGSVQILRGGARECNDVASRALLPRIRWEVATSLGLNDKHDLARWPNDGDEPLFEEAKRW